MEIAFETYNSIQLPVVQSDALELRDSAVSGRGVFAARDLPHGSLLRLAADATSHAPGNKREDINSLQSPAMKCTELDSGRVFEPLSPTAHVVFRPYRKEVCGECFRYDRGREWKLKLLVENGGGLVFCSEDCRNEWMARYGSVGLEAFSSLETVTRKLNKRQADVVADTSNETSATDSSHANSLNLIRQRWDEVRKIGQGIVEARKKPKPSKAERTILRQFSGPDEVDLDIPYYLLTGVLSAFVSAKAQQAVTDQGEDGSTSTSASVTPSMNTPDMAEPSRRVPFTEAAAQDVKNPCDSSFDVESLLPSLLTLAPDPSCYCHPASSLSTFTTAYLLLLTVLPPTLLRFLTPQLAHELNSRASHNAFSIRPSGMTDGEQSGEFMGWGVWPSASFFNHSCRSNVTKIRVGRQWHFKSGPGAGAAGSNLDMVKTGAELCITYLGGDEQDLDLTQRRQRLLEGWGFLCNCLRCIEEEGKQRDSTQALPEEIQAY